MRIAFVVFVSMVSGLSAPLVSAEQTHGLSVHLSIAGDLQEEVRPEGRLFLFLCEHPRAEPRRQTWPVPWVRNHIFAINLEDFQADRDMLLDASMAWVRTPDWDLDGIPEGTYYVQVLWDQDRKESGINAPGNLYSRKQEIVLNNKVELELVLDQQITEPELPEHELLRYVDVESDTLSAWWGKPNHLKASVLLPAGYKEGHAYPIRYNVAGYGGRYTRVNYLLHNEEFMGWWTSGEAPQVINVFLDGEGPFGDPYQMDSENNGPYGYALIHELIPYVEDRYRGTDRPDTRFVDGCSTGGWVSLGLQLYYPEFFNGAFSYSPDAVEFSHYQLIDIYRDRNAFVNEYSCSLPIMRNVNGEPLMSFEHFLNYENVLGESDTYVTSGGQLGSHAALYGPRGEDGLPVPLIDPLTGDIDREVAEHWKRYDFRLYAQEHWEELGPKIDGKIYVWMGDMDNFYLNPAMRAFSEFLEGTEHPVSNAVFEFSPMEGHCTRYSHREVLEKIGMRLRQMEGR